MPHKEKTLQENNKSQEYRSQPRHLLLYHVDGAWDRVISGICDGMTVCVSAL